jgi:ubiquinone/menaquinone biosynthesis C-methylase UbiE
LTNKEWDQFHTEIQMETSVDKDYEKFLKRFYRDDKEKRMMLDIGCGQGSFLAYTSYYYKEWTCCGVDFSWKALQITNARLNDRKNVRIKQCNADKILYPNEMFDLITVNVLFSSIGPEEVLPEIVRLLKPKGRIFIKELSDNECNKDNKYIRRGESALKYNEQCLYKLFNEKGFGKIETYKVKNEEQNVEHVVLIGRKS